MLPCYQCFSLLSCRFTRNQTPNNPKTHSNQAFESDPEVVRSNDKITHDSHDQSGDCLYAKPDKHVEGTNSNMVYAEVGKDTRLDAAITPSKGWAENNLYSTSNTVREETEGWMDNSIYAKSAGGDNI